MGNRFASSTNYLNACRNGDINTVKKYINSVRTSEIKKITDTKDPFGWNGLLLAARNGNSDIFLHLMDKYCDINNIDDDGNNSFLFSCQFGHIRIVEICMEKKIDTNVKNKLGYNGFLLACQEGFLDVVMLLLAKGYTDILACNNDGQNALILASQKGSVQLLQLLIDKGIDISSTDKKGNNPFHLACKGDKIENIMYFIEKGLKVGTKNHSGMNALLLAAQKGNKAIVDLLLSEDSLEKNAQNNIGNTALHLSCLDGNIEAIKCLIDHDCNISIQNNYGKTALDYLQNHSDKKREIEQYINNLSKNSPSVRNTADMKKSVDSHVELIQSFLIEHCGLTDAKANILAKTLVCTEHVDTIKKLESLQKRKKLSGILHAHQNSCDLSLLDIECIIDHLNDLINNPISRNNSYTDAVTVGGGSSITPTLWNCFMTHNWGEGNGNHLKVARINEALQKRGIVTWFDGDRMDGDTRQQMIEGIENSTVVVVFITDLYRNKVNQADDRDNCRFEFKYSFEQKGNKFMIPVVMEAAMRNTHEWKGYLGATLGTMLYVDFSEMDTSDSVFEAKITELFSRISSLLP